VVSQSEAGTDTLTNIEGLIGTNSGDTLAGGMGDQWFRGRGGSDILDGGVGSDTADYSMDPGAVTVNLALGTATDGWGGIWGLQGNDQLISIENLVGSQFNDTLTGDANANVIDGGNGNDTIKGGAGDDTLAGGPGRGPADLSAPGWRKALCGAARDRGHPSRRGRAQGGIAVLGAARANAMRVIGVSGEWAAATIVPGTGA